MLNKRASTLTIEEVIRLIVIVAGIFLIILLVGGLMYNFIFGKDEALKSYFKTFQDEMKKVDSGEIGEFEIWQKFNEKEEPIYLVYFNEESVYSKVGNNRRFFIDNSSLVSGQSYENYICVCRPFVKDGAEVCNKKFCMSLKEDAFLLDKTGKSIESPWAIGFNQKISMAKEQDTYFFRLV